MTLDDMQIAMEKYYRVLHAGEDDEDDNESSELMALNVEKARAYRESLCFNCGKKGHKANFCPQKDNNNGGNNNNGRSRFKGKCNFCDKIGHKKAQYSLNPENKSERPA